MLEIVEGWTGPVDMQLKKNGSPVSLTGCTVTLVLRGKDGLNIDTASNISVLDAPTGQVRYLPDAGDLVAAKTPHWARFRVVDASSKIVFFPSDRPMRWTVYQP